MLVLVYVDDIIITGSKLVDIQNLIQALNNQFSLKDLGDLNFFLGIEVFRDHNILLLIQSKYIKELLSKTKMTDANCVPSPMISAKPLTLYMGDILLDPELYHITVGALQYLTVTRN